ncbi:zinc finger CCCH domain-containing protein 5 [Andrographis paniculata]|uniref:zinc finger CCCH domain-containing protein 5 n=1 Tax=Andrographis paniculata TaxID=175694 RepID=UPI0021E8D813|nr:zinc finger CCCH domain-containing protein 5 [Andrographis paniculata]
MSDREGMDNEIEEKQAENNDDDGNCDNTIIAFTGMKASSGKERRKLAKKERRKKKRREMAELALREEEARLNDPEEVMRLQAEEEQEKLRLEKEWKEFEERERKIMEEWDRRKAEEQTEEEERRRKAAEEEEHSKQNLVGDENEEDENGWEYVEDGPPEIIWQGNEIIVKKKRIRVKKKDKSQHIAEEDPNRPTSNPLPPQSEAFADYKNLSAQELLENVAQETPNFGTEQDKAHCPFHLKTGACRFGSRCSRIHFYPDKSCTLLIKNMYNGPGLAWEQDEGLEHTDEEVERAYEEFYEDVHTEFLKFGEIVNFKVCRNGSSHLRGNVYVHYKSLDSAVMAYQSANGRYYAGKQIQCEFVGLTRWKVAICGEFMKSRLQTCSRGTTCNFIHCFRNPGGDYEWADWDKPPPKYWLAKMAALFGNSDEYGYDRNSEQGSPRYIHSSSRISTDDTCRHWSRRSQSREIYESRRSRKDSEDNTRSSAHGQRHRRADRKPLEILDEDASNFRERHHSKSRKSEYQSGKSGGMNMHRDNGDSGSDSDHYDHRVHKRTTRHREKQHKKSHGAGSKEQWLEQVSVSPDYWSVEERDKSPRKHDSEEFEYRKTTRSTRHEKHPNVRGELEKHHGSHLKKSSKRKRDKDSKLKSEGHVSDNNIDKRDRWEPDIDEPAEVE